MFNSMLMDIQPYLQHFKRISDTTYRSRCPICGDSKKNTLKTRFNIYYKDNKWWVHCFNCSYSKPLDKYVKEFHKSIYLKNKLCSLSKKEHIEHSHEKQLHSLNKSLGSYLSVNINRYLQKRKIHNRYYKYFSINDPDTNYLKIECYNGHILRLITNDKYKLRYVKVPHNSSKMYFENIVDESSRDTYIFEGIFDAISINANSIAVLNASLSSFKRQAYKNYIYVHDNEPRNPEIIREYQKSIKKGYNVFIPNTNQWQFKDINEALENGITESDIKKYIDKHTYNGPLAQLEFNLWKKC